MLEPARCCGSCGRVPNHGVAVVADLAVLVVGVSRLYREAVCSALERAADIAVHGTATWPTDAIEDGSLLQPDVVLVDAGIPDAVAAVLAFQRFWPGVRVVVLAASEGEPDLVRLAEAGVSGFVLHDESVEQLAAVIYGVTRGEASCPPRLAAALLQRVSALAARAPHQADEGALTTRELEIATLVAEGLSNKEIARRLHITLATTKNHVHSILKKLQVTRRADVGQRLRVIGAVLEH
jgi:two-component system, NarL family, nitrate/nitrite response regulator NarL